MASANDPGRRGDTKGINGRAIGTIASHPSTSWAAIFGSIVAVLGPNYFWDGRESGDAAMTAEVATLRADVESLKKLVSADILPEAAERLASLEEWKRAQEVLGEERNKAIWREIKRIIAEYMRRRPASTLPPYPGDGDADLTDLPGRG